MQGEQRGRRWTVTAGLAFVCVGAICVNGAAAAPPQISKTTASHVTGTSGTLEADINPNGKVTRWHFEYGASDCASHPCATIPIPEGEIPLGGSPVSVKATVEGLAPGTAYHFRTTAKNGEGGTIKGPDRVFATRGATSEGLPDGRAYEQSSPVDKDGGDVTGKAALVKAAIAGDGITFNSTFGIPGGKGAQAFPTYLALRGGESGWVTQGLLPPPIFGERARVQGWLPDFSRAYTNAERLGSPRTKALVEQSTAGGSAAAITPYAAKAEYSYAGASADASVVFFESRAKLPPAENAAPIEGAIEGKDNLYAWDRATGRVSLAAVMNDGKAPPQGAFAGPYDWSKGIGAETLRQGGAARGYYLQDTHAVTDSGNVYFTNAGTGQLYLRLNPTRPQSDMEDEKCLTWAAACTIHVSASKRGAPDPAGAQPAAFQAASADGSAAFFTSPEKLTNDANTGPEQPAPAVGIGSSAIGAIERSDFIPKRAIGVAVDSEHVYWADPVEGMIGRADLNGENRDDAFLVPRPSECEFEVETGVFEAVQVASSPRWVAVDSGHLYWTNTGKLDGNGDPVEGSGSIGRADIDGENAVSDFICGASNPQGIAVNATHVYWINTPKEIEKRWISRAGIGGAGVEEEFFDPGLRAGYGMALSPTHLYFSLNDEENDFGSIRRIPLEGGADEFLFVGKAGVRGVAVDAGHVYWATQGEEAIGRADLELESASREKEFTKPTGKLFGLAADHSHLYWSVNGESPTNPGNDLYRYRHEAGELLDLTADSEPGDPNGAEVQGVLGVSEDGSHAYFAANGDLDGGGGATRGDCQTAPAHGSLDTASGSCSVYLWHEGSVDFVGRVKASGGEASAGALNWTGTPRELFSTAGYAPKTAFVSQDGQTLLFRSQEKLTAYDNEGVSALYRYSASDQALVCISCPPSGERTGWEPSLGSVSFPGPLAPALASVAMVQSRNLSAGGNRAFFETAEALVPTDTNGEAGCPGLGSLLTPACLDVYEWEAPGSGSCEEGGEGYSPLNEGCVYLISTGKSEFPSFFADASESGGDAFFFTRQDLVGQDKDELQDVYDARVGGGLASQDPVVGACPSVEACRAPTDEPPAESSPGSASFIGAGNPTPRRKHPNPAKHKAKKHKRKKAHAKWRKRQ
jgi:hypothetical protein